MPYIWKTSQKHRRNMYGLRPEQIYKFVLVWGLTRFVRGFNKLKTGFSDETINTVEHLAIKRLENVYYKINLNGMNMNDLNIISPKEINSLM